MEYTEYPAPASLALVVRWLWTLTGHARRDLGHAVQPVLPDGCPELVVHFGDTFERVHPNGFVERQSPVLLAGQLTSQLSLRPRGSIAVVGIRCQPCGAGALVDVPQHNLAGLTIGLDAVSRELDRSLNEVRGATATPAAAVPMLLRRLAARVDVTRIDSRIAYAVQTVARTRGRLDIDRLARDCSLTRRHLERQFQMLVGVSPKRLARITRFQCALRMLQESDAIKRGTRTATACGYADQSHFIREFRELAGCSPEAHLLRKGELSGFFAASPVLHEPRDQRTIALRGK